MGIVSVVISTWNRPHLLKRAILSVLSQTIQPLEVFVCADGMEDPAEKVVKEIGHPTVKYVPGPHMGRPAIPRNRGIRAANGEWVAFLDDDDEWLPNKLEKQLAVLKKEGYQASCSNALRICDDNSITPFYKISFPPHLHFEEILQENKIICSSALAHSSLFKLVDGFPEDSDLVGVEDYALWLRIACLTDWVYISEPILRYRDAPSQSIRSNSSSEFEQRRRVLQKCLDWMQNVSIAPRFRWKTRMSLLKNRSKEARENLRKLYL